MNFDDDEDEILPEARIFDNRVDDIWNTKMEAYEELFHKNEVKEKEDALESEKKELLSNIAATQKNRLNKTNNSKSRKGKKKALAIPAYTSPSKPATRSSQRVKNLLSPAKSIDLNDAALPDAIQLPASAKKRLQKLQRETERQRKRVDEETRRILSPEKKKTKKSNVVEVVECDLEQNIDLKFRYLSRISKITVGQEETFNSIFKKAAGVFELEPAEVLFCLGDKTIGLSDTPESINIRSFEIIDCLPYKPEAVSEKVNADKLLLKIQSNDTRKKTEIYTHKLEKLEEVMKRYAETRKIPLKDLVFEFDGEKIEGSETPADLDMESGSCIDVIVSNVELPKPRTPPKVNVKPIPKSEMLDICMLD